MSQVNPECRARMICVLYTVDIPIFMFSQIDVARKTGFDKIRTPQDIQKKGNLAPAEGRTHWLQPMGGVSLSKYLVGGLHRV